MLLTRMTSRKGQLGTLHLTWSFSINIQTIFPTEEIASCLQIDLYTLISITNQSTSSSPFKLSVLWMLGMFRLLPALMLFMVSTKAVYLWDSMWRKQSAVALMEVGHAILLVSIHLTTHLPQESHMSGRPRSLNKESASSRLSKAPWATVSTQCQPLQNIIRPCRLA